MELKPASFTSVPGRLELARTCKRRKAADTSRLDLDALVTCMVLGGREFHKPPITRI
jgi:hypothetical protein